MLILFGAFKNLDGWYGFCTAENHVREIHTSWAWQVGWRRFCAWLLQTTRALNRAGEGRAPAPPPTDSLLETVAQLREGGLTSSLFDHQVTPPPC